jgi:nicotinate dehydrogenase subunit B
VYVQGQSLNGIPVQLSSLLNIPAANIRVVWYEGASSFGGGQQGECAEQAALLSQKIGKPVRVQWMRWDQHGWDHWGMANLWDVTMGADKSGKITVADWQSYGQQQANIDQLRLRITPSNPGGVTWSAGVGGTGGLTPTDTIYSFVSGPSAGQKRVLAKTQPLYGGALKANFLRAPSAPQQHFASEQIIDELAHAANMDPIAFRRLNIDGSTTTGARWLAALDGATQAAGWKPKVAASNLQSGNIVTGRGFGFGTFASSQVAIVADVQVNKKTGRMVATHLTIAQNNGITVSPQNVGNQMSGAVIQGLSRAMWEKPSWTKERLTSVDWVTYPILRFKDTPTVTLVNVHPGEYKTVVAGDMTTDVSKGNTEAFNEGWLLTGSGEPPTAAIAGAMANAFFDATGARIRTAPMRPEVVRGALKAAGVA